MEVFRQHFLFNKAKIECKETGILYFYGNIINHQEEFIAYEDILFNNITRQTKTDMFNLFVCLLSLSVVLKSTLGVYENPNGMYKGLLPLSFIFFVFFLTITIVGRTKFLLIETVNGIPIKLFYNKSHKNKLDQFLKQFKFTIKGYLKTKYADVDKDIPKETQLENIFWLKKSKIISNQEYEALKGKLLDRE